MLNEEQLRHAEQILAERSDKEDKRASRELLAKLIEQLHFIIKDRFQLKLATEDWFCTDTLAEVAYQSRMSLRDFRHRYPYNIAAIKYISVISFWIIKLKPISTMAFMNEGSGELLSIPNVNEAVAQRWALLTICDLVEQNTMPELTDGTENFFGLLKRTVELHYSEPIYDGAIIDKTQGEISRYYRNSKFAETVYYHRFKKTTAINMYEALLHFLVPIKFQALERY